MKINRIELTNYRNHVSGSFQFTDGINLLLGKNGSGKSSILEALGVALFNTGNRTDNADTVHLGANTANIRVEFTANDGISYTVEKNIGISNNIKLSKTGDSSSRITGVAAVADKMKELSGISTNIENIYKNIVTAYQNKLTSVFTDTPTERAGTFNKIFDTEIYRRIYQGYAKDFLDSLINQSSLKTATKETLQSQYEDKEKIKEDITKLQSEISLIENKIKSKQGEISSTEKQEKQLNDLKNNIGKTEQNIASFTEFKKREKSALDDAEAALNKSKTARNIIEENQDKFHKYSELSLEIKKIDDAIKQLELSEKMLHDTEKHISSINQQLELNQSEINNLNEKSAEISSKLDEKNKKSKEAEQKIASENLALGELQNNISELNKQKTLLDNLINEDEKLEKQINDAEVRIREKGSSLIDEEENQTNIKLSSEELEKLNKLMEERKAAEARIHEINTRIADNREAAKVLAQGVCPYLQEDCRNIISGTEPEAFFTEKEENLNEILLMEKSKLSKYTGLDLMINNVNTQKAIFEKAIKDNELILGQINSEKMGIEILKQKILENHIEVQKIFIELQKLLALTLPVDKTELQLKLNDLLTKLKTDYAVTNSNLIQLTKDFNELKNEIENDNKALNEIKYKISEKNGLKDELHNRLSEGLLVLEKLKIEVEPLLNTKIRSEELKNAIEKLKPAYDLFVSNLQSSNELESWKIKIKQHIEKCNELDNRIQNTEEELTKLKAAFSEDALTSVQTQLKKLRDELNEILPDYGELKSRIEQRMKDMLKSIEIEKQIASLEKELIILARKKLLTEAFRTGINDMGKHVAARYLNKVEILATENYRRISGRSESIKWVNDATHSYEVQLAGAKYIRKFEQLSGGEQVSVAIALRAAMASLLTQANFAIFDEPTNNLDAERKAALSESLNDMLNNLQQAIIVTHDESFREMAQNIIQL